MAWTDKLADFLRLNDGEQAYVGYPQMQVGLNKPRQAGYATGFLEGATGMDSMQPKNPITDPNYDQYAQGKNISEAVGIGVMALPAYAMALRAGAPKAYNALENYMVKSGGMIPLEAYHGTPHKIQGAFDISKVGTGEGAQAYGHGMYFAENPAVATEYRKALSGRTDMNLQPSDPAFIHAVESFREYGTPLEQIPTEMKKAYKSATDKDIKLAIQATEKGNLYKVNIPDEHIPNMLDWDKPLSQQSDQVKKGLDSLINSNEWSGQFKKELERVRQTSYFDGNDLYAELIKAKSPQEVSKMLNEYGITGIRYLDQGSRGIGKGSSNFVLFDPSTVKILEENGKPYTRKELIQQQIDKIE
jgi:hypothetical protein